MSKGIELIKAERKRQIEVLGYDQKQDEHYADNQLADAAICYAVDPNHRDTEPFPWPWGVEYWKPSPLDRVRELVKAGALIAAQIDYELNKP